MSIWSLSEVKSCTVIPLMSAFAENSPSSSYLSRKDLHSFSEMSSVSYGIIWLNPSRIKITFPFFWDRYRMMSIHGNGIINIDTAQGMR